MHRSKKIKVGTFVRIWSKRKNLALRKHFPGSPIPALWGRVTFVDDHHIELCHDTFQWDDITMIKIYG